MSDNLDKSDKPGMDLATVIGLVIAVVAILGGQTLEDLHRSGDVHRDEKTLAA